jgi:hypothetical protein
MLSEGWGRVQKDQPLDSIAGQLNPMYIISLTPILALISNLRRVSLVGYFKGFPIETSYASCPCMPHVSLILSPWCDHTQKYLI